jgi:serine/threonine protein phosphatase PrpC
MKRENRLHLLTEEFIDLAKNVNETDNAIIVFSKLKNVEQ